MCLFFKRFHDLLILIGFLKEENQNKVEDKTMKTQKDFVEESSKRILEGATSTEGASATRLFVDEGHGVCFSVVHMIIDRLISFSYI